MSGLAAGRRPGPGVEAAADGVRDLEARLTGARRSEGDGVGDEGVDRWPSEVGLVEGAGRVGVVAGAGSALGLVEDLALEEGAAWAGKG